MKLTIGKSNKLKSLVDDRKPFNQYIVPPHVI